MTTKDEPTYREAVAPPASGKGELNVALYRGVPDYAAFETSIQAAWEALGTGYRLNWRKYDPYRDAPPRTLDVFAFDCIYAADLEVEPIPWKSIGGADDLAPWTRLAVQIDRDHAAGIPYLGCMSTLFWRRNDRELAQLVSGLAWLSEFIRPGPFDPMFPEPGRGLLIDLSGSTIDACLYVAAWEERRGSYGPKPELPGRGALDAPTMGTLSYLVSMAGRRHAGWEDDEGFARLVWFRDGYGRAYVGVTETMAYMTAKELAALSFAPLALTAHGGNTHTPCYVDAIGIRPGLSDDDRAAALKFANLVASSEVLVEACNPAGGSPRYLIPARRSAFDRLADELPTYARIRAVLEKARPSPLLLGPKGRQWVRDVGPVIRSQLTGKPLRRFGLEPPRPAGYEQTPAGLWRRGD
jgi:thiamine pyridinylase